jgi:hypothetical protein
VIVNMAIFFFLAGASVSWFADVLQPPWHKVSASHSHPYLFVGFLLSLGLRRSGLLPDRGYHRRLYRWSYLLATSPKDYIDHRAETTANVFFVPIFFASVAMKMYSGEVLEFFSNPTSFGLVLFAGSSLDFLGKVIGAGFGGVICRFKLKDSAQDWRWHDGSGRGLDRHRSNRRRSGLVSEQDHSVYSRSHSCLVLHYSDSSQGSLQRTNLLMPYLRVWMLLRTRQRGAPLAEDTPSGSATPTEKAGTTFSKQ